MKQKNSQAYRQLQLFLESYRKQNKSYLTIRSYRTDISQFIAWCNSRQIQDLRYVTPPMIEDYLLYLEQGTSAKAELENDLQDTFSLFGLIVATLKILRLFKNLFLKLKKFTPVSHRFPLAVGSRKRHLSSLKNFFDFAVESNFRDPFKGFSQNPIRNKLHYIKLKEADIAATPMLAQAEWEKIDLIAHRPLDRLLLLVLYYWGLRLHEAAALCFEDFDFQNQSLLIKRKGGKIHHFRPRHWAEIQKLVKFIMAKEERGHGPLFASKKSKASAVARPMTERALYHKVKRIVLKAKLNSAISPHSFRKACATNLYLKTRDLLLVRDYLNHSDAKVTQTYIDQVTLEKNRELTPKSGQIQNFGF